MTALATYLGHVNIYSTYWYLQAAPDLLQDIAKRHKLTVHLTITTINTRLARILEPRAPRPDLRIRTLARLREAGIRAVLQVALEIDTGPAAVGLACLTAQRARPARADVAGGTRHAAGAAVLVVCLQTDAATATVRDA